MSDETPEDGKPKFDINAWNEAYNSVPEENLDFNDPDSTGSFLQKLADEAGLGHRLLSVDEYQAHITQQEINLENIIAAELGEDTVVRIVPVEGEPEIRDLAKNKHSWEAFKNVVKAYRARGDNDSVGILMSIFPEHSQLQSQLEDELKGEEISFNGYDSRIGYGGVAEVVRGHQFDLLPGSVDFRDFIVDDNLDVDSVAAAMFDDMDSKETVYADDWDGPNQTLDNIKKKFGDTVALEVADRFMARYNDTRET